MMVHHRPSLAFTGDWEPGSRLFQEEPVMDSHAHEPWQDAIKHHRVPFFYQCPTCEKPTAMNIKAIHRSIFHGKDTIVYVCNSCGTEKTEILT